MMIGTDEFKYKNYDNVSSGNHELELKVNLVFSAPLPGWADDEGEEQSGNGEMMATITEISILMKLGQRSQALGEI